MKEARFERNIEFEGGSSIVLRFPPGRGMSSIAIVLVVYVGGVSTD